MTQPPDAERPLVGEHPYVAAARERAHPTPAGDPQVVGDLDRLQLAERELGNSLASARDQEIAALAGPHQERTAELRRFITELGGVPSDQGLRELPHELEQMAGLADPRALYLALEDNARVLADRYAQAVEHAGALAEIQTALERDLAATRLEAARFAALARRA